MSISRDATGEDITTATPPVRRGRRLWKNRINTTNVPSVPTAPIQSTEVMKKRGPGKTRKKPIYKPAIKTLTTPPQETNNHEEVSASSDTETTTTRRSPKRRCETSVSSKSDDDISGLKREITTKKQAVKQPWHKQRRLLPIEDLTADDQRTLAMFDFGKSDVSAEELEGLYEKAYKYMNDLKAETSRNERGS